MEAVTQVLDQVVFVSFRDNAFENDINPHFLKATMDKIWGRLGSLALEKKTDFGDGKLWFSTVFA